MLLHAARALRGGRSGTRVFVAFALAQVLALAAAIMVASGVEAVRRLHSWKEVAEVIVLGPFLAGFAILFAASLPVLATSLGAGLARRWLGSVPLALLPVLAVAWVLLAMWQVSLLDPWMEDEPVPFSVLGFAWGVATLSLPALLPLLAAWWWTRPAR